MRLENLSPPIFLRGMCLGLLGDFAKGFIIVTVAGWIFAIAVNIATGQFWMVLLLLVLLIPISMIAYEYLRYRKKES